MPKERVLEKYRPVLSESNKLCMQAMSKTYYCRRDHFNIWWVHLISKTYEKKKSINCACGQRISKLYTLLTTNKYGKEPRKDTEGNPARYAGEGRKSMHLWWNYRLAISGFKDYFIIWYRCLWLNIFHYMIPLSQVIYIFFKYREFLMSWVTYIIC